MRSKVQRRAEHREALREKYRKAITQHWEAKGRGAHEGELERLAAEVLKLQAELALMEKGA
jgi:hypothetical protein